MECFILKGEKGKCYRGSNYKMSKELLTVIVPAYNVEAYVEQCLNSLWMQTVHNHKVIIVDDGSKDKYTSQICKSYAQKYPEMFTYIYQENKGLGAARNTGLKLVDTEYVGFLDSDDWLVPNYMEVVTEKLEKCQDNRPDLIFTLPIIYDSLTQNDAEWYDKGLFYQIFCSGKKSISAKEDVRLYNLEPNACRRIYRVDFIKKCNFQFPVGVKWEDIYPHFWLLHEAESCIGIDDVGFHYRKNIAGQITGQSGSGRLDIINVFQDVFDYAERGHCEWKVIRTMIKMLNNYTKWCIDMSDINTRRELVVRTSDLYRSIPGKYLQQYFKEASQGKQERLFVWCMRHDWAKSFFYDYLPEELMRNVSNRLLRRR